MGLSPRGRGNQGAIVKGLVWLLRSIPAWAGEPLASALPDMVYAKVYPRVGGGTVMDGVSVCASSGLSPRGRGSTARRRERKAKVYPRVGGGTLLRSLQAVSPR